VSARDDIALAALVQADQLQKAEARAESLRGHLRDVRTKRAEIADELDALESHAAALLAELGLDGNALSADPDALDRFEPTADEIATIDASLPTFASLRTVPIEDEGEFRKALHLYAREEGINLDADPITALLPANEIARARASWAHDTARLPWDRWDYALVGGAAVLGAVLDVALVSVPLDSVWKGVKYTGSPLTKLLRETSAAVTNGDGWLSRLQRALEAWAKVPYDIARNDHVGGINIDGLRPAMHRIMSPGHDPVLGFIFGVLDILRGTCSLVDRHGAQHVIANGVSESSPFVAVIKQVAHLLSDLPTSAGLPPPFFTALQRITAKSPFSVSNSGETLSIADLTRWMYGRGYDLRHFATMSVVPFIVEAVVRVGFFARNHERLDGSEGTPRNLVLKRDEMLLAAHAMTASTNALKVSLMANNPLAINYAVWLSTATATLRWLRSRAAHDLSVQHRLAQGWKVLLQKK
jgi:uncharacterized membrane protein